MSETGDSNAFQNRVGFPTTHQSDLSTRKPPICCMGGRPDSKAVTHNEWGPNCINGRVKSCMEKVDLETGSRSAEVKMAPGLVPRKAR